MKKLSTVFLSYDEPNAEENFKHLLTLIPDARRVDGVKGSDTAHKRIAEICDSEWVLIVDGDNRVNENILDAESHLVRRAVYGYSGKNCVNGLQYGNGGPKIWDTSVIRTMNTHENSKTKDTVTDFNLASYVQTNTVGSEVLINSSALQAWRAGFREGVKLLLDSGQYSRNINNIDWRNFHRLWCWMHIGQDVERGIWAILGARMGCLYAVERQDLHAVQDFDQLNYMFDRVAHLSDNQAEDEANRYGRAIADATSCNTIVDVYSAHNSYEYKQTVRPILRVESEQPYDIVFISYGEQCADENFKKLRSRFPRAIRVDNISGIHQAHIHAAKQCSTDYFWVVDADAIINDDFNFDYRVPFYDVPRVRVWRSLNPVNGLVYGYGGVKLLPRIAAIHMSDHNPDMSTSISSYYEPVMVISNTTGFNYDSFSSWRSAFRECAKLASSVIDNQDCKQTVARLNIWTSIANGNFSKYVLDGARAGKLYGQQNTGNIAAIKKINDFKWLKQQYDEFYRNTI